MGLVEIVSRGICEAAGKSVNKVHCVLCDNGQCTLWKEFKDEARVAIRLVKEYKGKHD